MPISRIFPWARTFPRYWATGNLRRSIERIICTAYSHSIRLEQPHHAINRRHRFFHATASAHQVHTSLGDHKDTIFALSSGVGKSAISVIRISGPDTSSVLHSLLPNDYFGGGKGEHRRREIEPRKVYLRKLISDNDQVLDSAMVIWFPQPNSFTGEDMAEIHVHGSRAVINSLFSVFRRVHPNLRPAEAGEFSKRAFMNDKMDLTTVEGLADLINSDTEQQRRLAIQQMGGGLSQLYEQWRKEMIKVLAHIEAFIDFGDDEEDIGEETYNNVCQRVNKLIGELKHHCDDNHKGEIIREGIHVGICGVPNVGKSSLLNVLAKRKAAIVTETPGTTRDIIEITIDLNGYPVKVFDTAGLRETDDTVESIGVDLAKEKLESCQLRIVVLDTYEMLSAKTNLKEYSILNELINVDSIIVLNKIDLVNSKSQVDQLASELQRAFSPLRVCKTSCNTETSSVSNFLSELSSIVEHRWNRDDSTAEPALITRSRHRQQLEECLSHLEHCLTIVSQPDCAAEELRLASRCLGKITGMVDVEEVLDTIFADFCIGK